MSSRQDDSAQIYPRNESDRYNLRRKHERHVYVVEFASGIVKVGQAMILKDRLNTHVRTAQAHGDSVTRTWASDVHIGYGDNERALIAFCAERWEPAIGAEYYRDADFDQIVEYAQGLPYERMGDAEIAAIRESTAHKVHTLHAELAARQELAALTTATNEAKDRVDLVTSLINNHNRWDASEALFQTYRKLLTVVPAAWAENDPAAAERYLVTCGASVEVAQRNALDYELDMRTLYAMQFQKEAESFEDIARFTSQWISARGEAS